MWRKGVRRLLKTEATVGEANAGESRGETEEERVKRGQKSTVRNIFLFSRHDVGDRISRTQPKLRTQFGL